MTDKPNNGTTLQCFSEKHVVDQLIAIGTVWSQATQTMLKAIDDEDRSIVLSSLLDISAYVDQYAKVASQRYAELVNKRPTPVPATKKLYSDDVPSKIEELEMTED